MKGAVIEHSVRGRGEKMYGFLGVVGDSVDYKMLTWPCQLLHFDAAFGVGLGAPPTVYLNQALYFLKSKMHHSSITFLSGCHLDPSTLKVYF